MRVAAVSLVLAFSLAGTARAERWAVKTLTDPGKDTVNLGTVVPTTIRTLVALPVPQEIFGPRGKFRRVAPVETTVWRVSARLVFIEYEADGDIHLVLAERNDPKITMIAEVPRPGENLAHAAEWRTARAAIGELKGETDRLVVVEGVGFFDFMHRDPPRGCAPNGAELHPVLRLEMGQ